MVLFGWESFVWTGLKTKDRWDIINDKFTLPKGLGEFLGADRFVAVLQLVENPLQSQGNALGWVVSLCGHHVHRLESQEDSHI